MTQPRLTYLLDSDVLIDSLAGDPTTMTAVDGLVSTGAGMSVVTYLELFEGALRGSSVASVRSIVQSIEVIPITLAIAERCAELRHQLRSAGRSVRPRALDLIIAATALEHGLVLATRNLGDYRDIPGLRLITV